MSSVYGWNLDIPMSPKYTYGQLTLLWEKFHQYRDTVGRNLISYPMLVRTSFGSAIIAYLTDSINATEIKSKSIEFEDHNHYGKVIDIDVYVVEKQGPRKIDRNECNSQEKKCIVCNKHISICAKQSTHTKEQIRSRMLSYVEEYNVLRCANNAFMNA
jgi:holo-ACP synthase CitX